jgi:hypothetical protein
MFSSGSPGEYRIRSHGRPFPHSYLAVIHYRISDQFDGVLPLQVNENVR